MRGKTSERTKTKQNKKKLNSTKIDSFRNCRIRFDVKMRICRVRILCTYLHFQDYLRKTLNRCQLILAKFPFRFIHKSMTKPTDQGTTIRFHIIFSFAAVQIRFSHTDARALTNRCTENEMNEENKIKKGINEFSVSR